MLEGEKKRVFTRCYPIFYDEKPYKLMVIRKLLHSHYSSGYISKEVFSNNYRHQKEAVRLIVPASWYSFCVSDLCIFQPFQLVEVRSLLTCVVSLCWEGLSKVSEHIRRIDVDSAVLFLSVPFPLPCCNFFSLHFPSYSEPQEQ